MCNNTWLGVVPPHQAGIRPCVRASSTSSSDWRWRSSRAVARVVVFCFFVSLRFRRRRRRRRRRGARGGGARAVRGGVFERGVGIRHRRAGRRASIDHLHPSPEDEGAERRELRVQTAVDDFHARLFRRRARTKGLEGECAHHAARPDAAHDAKLVALDGVDGVVPIRRRRR